jgi:hypothetical protein
MMLLRDQFQRAVTKNHREEIETMNRYLSMVPRCSLLRPMTDEIGIRLTGGGSHTCQSGDGHYT